MARRMPQPVGPSRARLLAPPAGLPAHGSPASGSPPRANGTAAAPERPFRRHQAGERRRTRPAAVPAHPTARVLVVDADPSMAQTLTRYLQGGGLCVGVATNTAEAAEAVERGWADLVVLDLPPGPEGMGLFVHLRRDGRVPVVLLSCYGDEAERVHWLNLGADDFVPGPVSPAEVVARVRSVLRRTGSAAATGGGRVQVGPVVVDEETHRCLAFGRPVTLTALEFKLLLHFLRHPGRVCTRETLLRDVWGFSVGATATVTVHVRRLREKIELDPSQPTLIQTVWGVGYRFQPASP